MTYDTWFMIYDTGCMIGDRYVYIYIETQIRCSLEKKRGCFQRSGKGFRDIDGAREADDWRSNGPRKGKGALVNVCKRKGLIWSKWYIYIYTVYTHQLDYSSCGMILEAAAILQLFRVFPGERFPTWEPSKISQVAARYHLFQPVDSV